MFQWLFDTESFVPRAECGEWSLTHIIINILAHVIIALAYYGVALSLWIIYKKRKVLLKYPKITLYFIVFIIASGTTQLTDVIIFKWPIYRVLTTFDFLTALISLFTTITLPKAVKIFLKLRTPEELEKIIAERDAEITRRISTEANVKELNHQLAAEVQILRNVVSTQGWIAEKQMDLDKLGNIIKDLRKEYVRPTS
jgi:hypothetical protein